MKNLMGSLAVIGLLFIGVPAHAVETETETGPAAALGAPAPDFTLTDTHGNTHTLSDYRGQNVILEWMNHDCPFVKKHYNETGNMPALQRDAIEQGDVWFTIVSSAPGTQGYTSPEEANEVMAMQESDETARLLDPEGAVGRLYGAAVTPHMYIIDAKGTLVYNGAIDDNSSANPATVEGAHNYVVAALTNIRAGEPVEVAQTRPYGCTVKYEDE